MPPHTVYIPSNTPVLYQGTIPVRSQIARRAITYNIFITGNLWNVGVQTVQRAVTYNIFRDQVVYIPYPKIKGGGGLFPASRT